MVICLLVTVALAIRQRNIGALARRRLASRERDLQLYRDEIAHLLTARLPAVADSQDVPGVAVPALRNAESAGTELAQRLDAVIELFSTSIEKARAHGDAPARASLMSAMRTLQALTNEQQSAISRMQERHDDPTVLRDLLVIDHSNAQIGRRAQAIAVLCGAWPGRQRASSTLVDVTRGATSRIRDYLRVEIHTKAGIDSIGLTGRSVEPVVLTVAELLDNAARHSQPQTMVQVNIQEVHNGAVIVIDDAGVGMNKQEISRATRILSGKLPVDVTRLGDPPAFGLPVAAVLANRYGFRVSLDSQSPYGGVRAVVFLPSALLTPIDDELPPPAAPTTDPDPAAPAADLPDAAPAKPRLPKRRRWEPIEETIEETAEEAATDEPPLPARAGARSARDAAATMGALQRGTRNGRSASRPEHTEPTAPPEGNQH